MNVVLHITVGCICSFLFVNIKTYLYLCEKITYTPCYKIVKIMEKEEVKNNEKYSIPIYENGVKTEWTIDGIMGLR